MTTTKKDLNAVVDRRYEFILLFDVQDGNPNGDRNEGEGAKPRGSNEPLVIVGIQLADLHAGLDGHAFGGGPVSAETVRKLACEGSVIPMVFNSEK